MCAKLYEGPTEPIAGPTFPIDVATDPRADGKSNPRTDMNIVPSTNIPI